MHEKSGEGRQTKGTMAKRTYTGEPFPKAAYAEMELGVGDDIDFPSFYDGELEDILAVDAEPKWVATYKLVSVRKVKRVSRIVAA